MRRALSLYWGGRAGTAIRCVGVSGAEVLLRILPGCGVDFFPSFPLQPGCGVDLQPRGNPEGIGRKEKQQGTDFQHGKRSEYAEE